MALDTGALGRARAQFEGAKIDGDYGAAETSLREALGLASEALVAARRGNNKDAKLEALDLVAQCNMYLGDMFAANLAVTDELAMIRRSKDANAEIRCLQLAAEVHTARGDGNGALDACNSALELVKKGGEDKAEDKAAKAKTLSQLSMARLAVGKGVDALTPAQDALKLFEELGDEAGEQEARRNVSAVFAARNQLDKAPGRPEALQALKDLAAAAETRSSLAWGGAMEALHRTGAFSNKDLDEVMSTAVAKDRQVVLFLEEQGMSVAVAAASGAPKPVVQEYPKTMHYISMRVGGLGYGPRFRCGQFVSRIMVKGDENSTHSAACLQTGEEADDWERNLQYHPGILDSMLQSSGMALPGMATAAAA